MSAIFQANATWIGQNGTGWLGHTVFTNPSKIVSDLVAGNIQYAILFVGYWNATNPAAPYPVYYDTTYQGGNYVPSSNFKNTFVNLINLLHAQNIKVIAWIEDGGGGTPDVSPANQANMAAAVKTIMDWGFDGYDDDIETGTSYLANWINYLQTFLHNSSNFADGKPRLNMPAVGAYDFANRGLSTISADFVCIMFYGATSAFDPGSSDNPLAPSMWQGDFANPTSPIILGICNRPENVKPLSYQLDQCNQYMIQYGYKKLMGFCIWVYEYMGTRSDGLDDWAEWNYWLAHIGTNSPPVLNTVEIDSSPLQIQFTANGVARYTPYKAIGFFGSSTIVVPTNPTGEINSILIGNGDHSAGGMGWNVYAYVSGPYTLSVQKTVNQVYLYSAVAGNVKVVLCDSSYNVIAKTSGTPVLANTWNLINFLTQPTLPAGQYYIAAIGDTTGILGSGAANGKWINMNYSNDWLANLNSASGGVQGGVNILAAYIPSAPLILTPYVFQDWNDGNASNSRVITLDANQVYTALYGSTAPPLATLNLKANIPAGFTFTKTG